MHAPTTKVTTAKNSATYSGSEEGKQAGGATLKGNEGFVFCSASSKSHTHSSPRARPITSNRRNTVIIGAGFCPRGLELAVSMAEREALQEAVRAQGEKVRQLKKDNTAQEEV